MMISTRGRYALKVMIYLSQNMDRYTSLKEIAENENVSQKYMEGIMADFSKKGLVTGVQGKNGGYKLTRTPDGYSIGEILNIAEGSIAPVSCISKDGIQCVKAEKCKTLPVWLKLDELIQDYLSKVTLKDVM